MASAKVGFARAVVTDCGKLGKATFDDDHYVGAAWIEADSQPALLLTLDTTWLNARQCAQLKEPIAQAMGLSSDRIVINSSHTHSKIELDYPACAGRMIEVAGKARSLAAPASFAFIAADTDGAFSINRRAMISPRVGALTFSFYRNNRVDVERKRIDVGEVARDFLRYGVNINHPRYRAQGADAASGPRKPSPAALRELAELPEQLFLSHHTDPILNGLVFYGPDGRISGSIVRFACHPITMSGSKACCSADFPGVLTGEIARATGAVCLFINGPCGDVKPLISENSPSEMRRMGLGLSAVFCRQLPELQREPLTHFRMVQQLETFPIAPDVVNLTAQDMAADERRHQAIAQSAFDPAELRRSQDRLLRIWAAVECYQHTAPTYEYPFYRLDFNDAQMITLPGEVFSGAALQIRQRLGGRKLMITTFSDAEMAGYVPMREDFPLGGYEVGASCLPVGSAERMVDIACELADRN